MMCCYLGLSLSWEIGGSSSMYGNSFLLMKSVSSGLESGSLGSSMTNEEVLNWAQSETVQELAYEGVMTIMEKESEGFLEGDVSLDVLLFYWGYIYTVLSVSDFLSTGKVNLNGEVVLKNGWVSPGDEVEVILLKSECSDMSEKSNQAPILDSLCNGSMMNNKFLLDWGCNEEENDGVVMIVGSAVLSSLNGEGENSNSSSPSDLLNGMKVDLSTVGVSDLYSCWSKVTFLGMQGFWLNSGILHGSLNLFLWFDFIGLSSDLLIEGGWMFSHGNEFSVIEDEGSINLGDNNVNSEFVFSDDYLNSLGSSKSMLLSDTYLECGNYYVEFLVYSGVISFGNKEKK